LIHDPEIIVLDEPTAGLDPQSRLVVTERIRELKETSRLTVILTTHEMEIADQLSDRVAIIDHGRLLVLDTPENLKDSIGKGDIMEIALYDESNNKAAIESLKGIEGIHEVNEIRGRIMIRALDAASKIPKVFALLDSIGARVLDVSLRRNSLEDVFITLTGRGLRE